MALCVPGSLASSVHTTGANRANTSPPPQTIMQQLRAMRWNAVYYRSRHILLSHNYMLNAQGSTNCQNTSLPLSLSSSEVDELEMQKITTSFKKK